MLRRNIRMKSAEAQWRKLPPLSVLENFRNIGVNVEIARRLTANAFFDLVRNIIGRDRPGVIDRLANELLQRLFLRLVAYRRPGHRQTP